MRPQGAAKAILRAPAAPARGQRDPDAHRLSGAHARALHARLRASGRRALVVRENLGLAAMRTVRCRCIDCIECRTQSRPVRTRNAVSKRVDSTYVRNRRPYPARKASDPPSKRSREERARPKVGPERAHVDAEKEVDVGARPHHAERKVVRGAALPMRVKTRVLRGWHSRERRRGRGWFKVTLRVFLCAKTSENARAPLTMSCSMVWRLSRRHRG